MQFVPSLELARMLYEEEIQPIMEQRFPGLPYAAATLGMCSEVLGLDDAVSMDHEWGPRLTLFLSEPDHARYAQEIMPILRKQLPATFKGFDMMWRKPGVDVHDTRKTILYHVGVNTVPRATSFGGSIHALPPGDLDWLRISEQHLLEFTSGIVYHDDIGELTKARELLAYYPDNVLRFLLMCEWSVVNSEWWPIGRIGPRGDQLGLRLQASKAAQHLMHIAFMVCKRYSPYKKWFGTLFKALPIADALEPVLLDLLQEDDWQKVEEQICQAATILLQQQNKLGLTPPITVKAHQMHDGRHHMSGDLGEIAWQLEHIQPPLNSLRENEVFWLHERSLILWNGEVGKWSLLLQK